MSSRVYGDKAQGGAWRTAAEIAKDIRHDIKEAQDAGELPGAPTRFSVRIDNYSMGRSIDVEIQDYDGEIERTVEHEFGHTRRAYTDDAQELIRKVNKIREAYNYDGSDVMTDYYDVNFYGSVTFETEFGKKERLKATEKARRRRAGELPSSKRPPKRELVDHVARHHRRSRNWANGLRYDLLRSVHESMHRTAKYEFDTDHEHTDADFPAIAGAR